MKNTILATFVVLLLMTHLAAAQQWTEHVRGSWISDGDGVTLADGGKACAIVVAPEEHSAVQQAAKFLAADIEKISGAQAKTEAKSPNGAMSVIHLVTLGNGDVPDSIDQTKLKGQWESYQIVSSGKDVWLVGSDFRGTAFAAYTLSERLGVDPLYLWTCYVPDRHEHLVMKPVNLLTPSPTFKYRGMFHDDEDILPRPFENSGYPSRTGDVPLEWYGKFFETALRLRMNMVAPWTRVHRRYEVQKMASDWGLFYTSHHYDILLSNPFGIIRYGLGEARNAGTVWDWTKNQQGMLNFWRGGVEENKDINCIWPVGLRGTDDMSYTFPKGMSDEEKNKIFNEVIQQQVQMTRQIAPADKPPVFHFTLYSEMLTRYEAGKFDLPSDVIVVWPDNNDGEMRSLPKDLGKWKHGVYYHLAYLGPQVKQSVSTVSPKRVCDEFKKIVDSGATEYMLVNVSELREFVKEARLISEICWDGKTALAGDKPDERYLHWFAREYFGDAAAPDVFAAYQAYYKIFDTFDKQFSGSEAVHEIIAKLSARYTHRKPTTLPDHLVDDLNQRDTLHHSADASIDAATEKMSWPQQQFFFDSVVLPLHFDRNPTAAAIKLMSALDQPNDDKAWPMIVDAKWPLDSLEIDILSAEHPPFEQWYRDSWIRHATARQNVHRPYEELRMFLATRGEGHLVDPPSPPRARAAPTTAPADATVK